MRRLRLAAAVVGAVLLNASPGLAADAITVASKIDTEGALLGNMIVQVLENAGLKVASKVQLGPTNIVRKAILAGEIDVYPEYTGNGAIFFKMADNPVWKDAAAGYDTVRRLDLEANNLVWLDRAPANNTWAIAVRGDVAAEQRLKTLEDFARWAREGGSVKLAASAEFVDSPAALPAFQDAYGFRLKDDQLLVLSGGNTATTIRAAADRTNGTNTAMVYGTDGGIGAANLVVMDDTKKVQMVYAPAPVVRKPVLDAHPEIRDLLNPLFASLDRETLQRLNGRIQVEGMPAREVARAHLKSKGLLK